MWNAYTTDRCCDANIPILDIFRISESNPDGLMDHVHYKEYVFKSAEKALLDFFSNIQDNSTNL